MLRALLTFVASVLISFAPAHAQDTTPPAQPPAEPEAAAELEAPAVEAAPAPLPPPPAEVTEEQVREQLAALAVPGGLTADQAAARAVESAPSLRRVTAVVAVAEAGARRAWQALFPQVELSARYTRLSPVTQPDFGTIGFAPDQLALAQMQVANVDDPDARLLWTGLLDSFGNTEGFSFPVILNNYALRASLTYPVSDLFFTILPGFRAAETAVDAQRAQSAVEERTVALRAREAFYELARARFALEVSDKAVEQVEAHRRQIEAMVEAGAAARVDLLRIDAQLATARVAAARAQGGAAVAARALSVLMHDEPNVEIQIGEDFSQIVMPIAGTLAELTERALAGRVEIEAIRRLAEAQKQSIEAELGRRYPQLLLQGGIDIQNPNNRIIPQQEEFRTTWDISVILRWSPNELGTARQRVAEVRAQLAQTEADIDGLMDGIRLEVAQAHQAFETSQTAFAATRVGLVAAEESYRVRRDQLEAGAAVTSDVIDAETDLTRARLDLIDSAISLRLARVRLAQATGEP